MAQNRSFVEKLNQAIAGNDSLLCLGLDPDPTQFPAHFPDLAADPAQALTTWGQTLIEQTADLVCCYKPNFAFYEQYGPPGLEALRRTIATVPEDIPVLLDAKRGDIGSTAAAYARAAFEVWGADAVTVNPYLGRDSVTPFLAFPGKMAFVLCYTSNPSAREIQEVGAAGGERLFERIARLGQTWGGPEQLALVVGATQPQALARVRALAPDRWILAPGVGAQGGDVAQALAAGLDRHRSGLIIPVSRSVIYAAEPRAAALQLQLRDVINQVRVRVGQDSILTYGSGARGQAGLPAAKVELILQLYEIGAIQFGEFTLASGQLSPIYIDLRRLSAVPKVLERVAGAYAELLEPLSFERLAAVPYAALTIGTAVALRMGKSLIYPRKEVKSYGTGRAIEGIFAAGERVVVLEDLVTSGGSVLKAIAPLAAAGLRVQEVVVLIDREQGGRQNLAGQGYRLHAALQLSQVVETLHHLGRISGEMVERARGTWDVGRGGAT